MLVDCRAWLTPELTCGLRLEQRDMQIARLPNGVKSPSVQSRQPWRPRTLRSSIADLQMATLTDVVLFALHLITQSPRVLKTRIHSYHIAGDTHICLLPRLTRLSAKGLLRSRRSWLCCPLDRLSIVRLRAPLHRHHGQLRCHNWHFARTRLETGQYSILWSAGTAQERGRIRRAGVMAEQRHQPGQYHRRRWRPGDAPRHVAYGHGPR